MINFNKTSLKKILFLLSLINNRTNIYLLTKKYKEKEVNFEETFDLLIKTKIILMNGNTVQINNTAPKSLNINQELYKKLIIKTLFENKTYRTKLFGDYLKNFSYEDEVSSFIPTLKLGLKYKGERNFLVSLGIINYLNGRNTYTVNKPFENQVLDLKRKLPYNSLVNKLKAREKLGQEAELLVLNYEKELFKKNPKMQMQITQVSSSNSNAGYDIKSISSVNGIEFVDKYIEVKAVSEINWQFYWSRNEIDTAKKLGDKYYLYLVHCNSSGTLSINNLKVIH